MAIRKTTPKPPENSESSPKPESQPQKTTRTRAPRTSQPKTEPEASKPAPVRRGRKPAVEVHEAEVLTPDSIKRTIEVKGEPEMPEIEILPETIKANDKNLEEIIAKAEKKSKKDKKKKKGKKSKKEKAKRKAKKKEKKESKKSKKKKKKSKKK